MTNDKNFKWLTSDIYSTLVINIMMDNNTLLGTFDVSDILETTGDKLEVKTANIDDLTNFLTLGIVRFVNVINGDDIVDIPFRNLYTLYQNASVLGMRPEGHLMTFKELEVFSVLNGVVRDDLLISSSIIDELSDDLKEIMKIAYDYGNYGMQEKFDAMSRVTVINHRRLQDDKKRKNI